MSVSVTPKADPAVRTTLRNAGVDLSEWTDPQLASVEFTAKALREGERVFVPTSMQPLVDQLMMSRTQSRR